MSGWTPPSELRIAFLGAGGINRTHARNLEKLLPGACVGVCSRDLNSAEGFARDHLTDRARPYDHLVRMLDEVQPNVVVVGLPPGAHEGQVEALAELGIALFLEKPIALDLARAQHMVAAVEHAGVPTQVGFHLRFAQPVAQMKAAVEAGAAGRPTLFQAIYRCHALHGSWWRDVHQSGGQTVEQAIHLYDLARFLFGEVEQVRGHQANLVHSGVEGYSIEDTAAALLRFDGGALGSISSSNAAIPTRWESPASAHFECMVLDLHTATRGVIYRTGGRTSESYFASGETVPEETITDGWDPYLKEMEAFVTLIQGHGPSVCPIREGLASQQVAAAVGLSAHQDGEAVDPRSLV